MSPETRIDSGFLKNSACKLCHSTEKQQIWDNINAYHCYYYYCTKQRQSHQAQVSSSDLRQRHQCQRTHEGSNVAAGSPSIHEHHIGHGGAASPHRPGSCHSRPALPPSSPGAEDGGAVGNTARPHAAPKGHTALQARDTGATDVREPSVAFSRGPGDRGFQPGV